MNVNQIKVLLYKSELKNKEKTNEIIIKLTEFLLENQYENQISLNKFILKNQLREESFLKELPKDFLTTYLVFIDLFEKSEYNKYNDTSYSLLKEWYTLFFIKYSQIVDNYYVEQIRKNSCFFSYPEEAGIYKGNNDTRKLKSKSYFGSLYE